MLIAGRDWWNKPLPESKAPYSKMLGAISSMANMGYDVSEAEKLIPQVFRAIEEERLIDVQILNARVFKALVEAPKMCIRDRGHRDDHGIEYFCQNTVIVVGNAPIAPGKLGGKGGTARGKGATDGRAHGRANHFAVGSGQIAAHWRINAVAHVAKGDVLRGIGKGLSLIHISKGVRYITMWTIMTVKNAR